MLVLGCYGVQHTSIILKPLNIHKYGNTSAASVPLALDEAIKEGKLKKGDLFITVAFGGGFSYGGALIEL